jgi:hypothetical protein
MKRTIVMVMCLLASNMHAYPQGPEPPPRMTGKYRCQLDPRECLLGHTFTVTLSGDRIDIASEKGEPLFARMTSDRSLAMGPPWNVPGVIYGSDIQWSNGTRWVKVD